MAAKSAGIIAYRIKNHLPEIFLVHPGGPFYARKDAGAWTIPKGEFSGGEDPLTAAQREFTEETGIALSGEFVAITPFKQKGGKQVFAWANETDFDAAIIQSNRFEMEWPPRSGKVKSFPEVDRGEWFDLAAARQRILLSQQVVIDELIEIIHEKLSARHLNIST